MDFNDINFCLKNLNYILAKTNNVFFSVQPLWKKYKQYILLNPRHTKSACKLLQKVPLYWISGTFSSKDLLTRFSILYDFVEVCMRIYPKYFSCIFILLQSLVFIRNTYLKKFVPSEVLILLTIFIH